MSRQAQLRIWLDHFAAAVQAMPPTRCLSIATVSNGTEGVESEAGPEATSGVSFIATEPSVATLPYAGAAAPSHRPYSRGATMASYRGRIAGQENSRITKVRALSASRAAYCGSPITFRA